MMINSIAFSMESLEKHANECVEKGKDLAILIEMPGFEYPETIINPPENIKKKMEYYKNVYDENCNHKHAKGIRIVAAVI